MVNITYHNKELESLITKGKSLTYKRLLNKRTFIKALHSFVALLSVIDNTMELKPYKWLKFLRGVDFSTVTIEECGISGNLLFKEVDFGHCIVLYDLILT